MWDLLIINPMVNTLLYIYSVIGNFGIAIIIFTILIRLITHPLTVSQMKSAQAMQEMQKSKEWQELQKKYKDDKQKLSQEQMRLYQEMGINPFGSCLPLLIQFPIIIGLYQAIIRALATTPYQLLDLSKHLYSFINAAEIIPLNNKFLWMDLSQPERLPVFGVGIPVLAIVVVITTYLQQKLMTPPPAQPGDQTAQMTQMMNLYMPLFIGYISYTLASGLALYFVTSNVVGILQYAAMGKLNWKNLLSFRSQPSAQKKRRKEKMSEKRTSLEIIAPTVAEAIQQGLEQLGVPSSQVSIDILDEGSRGLFGIGARQARVRLTLQTPTSPLPATPAPEIEDAQAAFQTGQPPLAGNQTHLKQAEQIVSRLLQEMRIRAQVTASYADQPNASGETPIHVDIRGKDLTILIGPQAETLNALQYLVTLIMGKQIGRAIPITIDVEGYRTRRENQLRRLARKMAEQALKTGRRQVLEPMPANERRIVHLELRDFEGVTTESIGEEPRRKVTIIPK
jgi:YidC/Oxa1 family membrane protein insertase